MDQNRIKRFFPSDDIAGNFDDDLGTVQDVSDYDNPSNLASIEDLLMQDTLENADDQSNFFLTDPLSGFTGRDRDSDEELYYHRPRHHDVTIGKWISEDID